MITIYGIKNCDTIKKAKKWLETNDIDYQFHDYRSNGLEKSWLIAAVTELGWKNVLNKRGTTYRQLPQNIKDSMNEDIAIEQMLLSPSIIKRPILQMNNKSHLGFKDTQYSEIFNK